MELPDCDLYCLSISIPTGYKDGEAIGYKYKSIGDILDDQNFFDLIVLEEWISQEILDYIDWNLDKPITMESIEKAFLVFNTLGINPKRCIYVEPEKPKGGINDNDE